MKRLFLVLGMVVMVLPWLAAARAQADMIEWTASGTPLGPNLNPSSGGTNIGSLNFGAGAIGMLPGPTTSETNSGSITAVEVGYSINPDSSSAATFGGPSANYSLSITLHDDASGKFGSLIFRGNLSGEITNGNYFTNTYLGPTTQTLKLGHDLYTVTMGPYVNGTIISPVADDGTYGTISATISAQPLTNSTPEPCSLLLACLGLPSLGLTVWRRRKVTAGDVSKA